MKKAQIDQYDMCLAVEGHFDDQPGVWNGKDPIVQTKKLFSIKLDELGTQVNLQLISSKGETASKATVRTSLESQAFVLVAAASGYANANGKIELSNRVRYTKTDLTRFRDIELVGICTNLLNDINTVLGDLAPYEITDEIVAKFKDTLLKFSDLMKTPDQAIALRKSATDKIAVLIPEAIEILTSRMDFNVVMLEATNPQFVEVYNNLRALNSSPTSHLSLTITCLDKATNVPVAHVELEIVEPKIKRVSSSRGYNTFTNLTAGGHQIITNHPNYKPQKVDFTIVDGETTELVILLEAK